MSDTQKTNELKMKRVFRDAATFEDILEDAEGRLYRRVKFSEDEVEPKCSVVWFGDSPDAPGFDGGKSWVQLTDAEVAKVSDPAKPAVPAPSFNIDGISFQPPPDNETTVFFGKGSYSVMETSMAWTLSGIENFKNTTGSRVQIVFDQSAEITPAGIKCLAGLILDKFGAESPEIVSFKVPYNGWHTDLEEEFVEYEFQFADEPKPQPQSTGCEQSKCCQFDNHMLDEAYRSGYKTGEMHGYARGWSEGQRLAKPLEKIPKVSSYVSPVTGFTWYYSGC